MIDIIFSPKWFYGKDIIIDIVSIIVLALISLFSWRYYRINKNRNYLLLSSSFCLMAVSYIFKILTNFTIYYKILETKRIGFLILTYTSIKSSQILYLAGFFIFRLLMLIGLFILFSIYQKKSKSSSFLMVYLIVMLTYFTWSAYYVFYITALILMIFITGTYLKTSRRQKTMTSRTLVYSFAIIALSQIFFIFISVNLILYVIAELIQLVGYLLLLYTFIIVIKHGKKKK